jgi:hypothetical protein
MRRRKFIAVVGGAATLPLAGHAQQPERMRRVGWLVPWAEKDPVTQASAKAFAHALGQLGWVEDKNIRIDSALQPVLDTVAETAARLCGADSGLIVIREGEVYRYVSSSTSAADPEYWAILRQRTIVPGRESIAGRVALEGMVVHVADIRAEPDYAVPEAVAAARRTHLGVPLMRDGEPIGVIVLHRKRVELFTERQIELVRTFADQAAIAMENARLINETREALEQQTATAEVLGVINSSPGDLAPVFEAMLAKAHSLCGADNGGLLTYDGERFWPVAFHGLSTPLTDARLEGIDPNVAPSFGRIVRGERLDHIHDMVGICCAALGRSDPAAAQRPRRN